MNTLTSDNPEKKRFLGRILGLYRLFTMRFSFRQSCDQLPRHRRVRFSRHPSANQQPSLPCKDLFARLDIKLQTAYRAIKFIRYLIKELKHYLKFPFQLIKQAIK